MFACRDGFSTLNPEYAIYSINRHQQCFNSLDCIHILAKWTMFPKYIQDCIYIMFLHETKCTRIIYYINSPNSERPSSCMPYSLCLKVKILCVNFLSSVCSLHFLWCKQILKEKCMDSNMFVKFRCHSN